MDLKVADPTWVTIAIPALKGVAPRYSEASNQQFKGNGKISQSLILKVLTGGSLSEITLYIYIYIIYIYYSTADYRSFSALTCQTSSVHKKAQCGINVNHAQS